MTQHGYYESKAALAKRLGRVEGQVRGIARMVDEDRYCIDILTQISAIEAAMDKIALELLRDHVRHCLAAGDTPEERTAKTDELVGAVARLLAK